MKSKAENSYSDVAQTFLSAVSQAFEPAKVVMRFAGNFFGARTACPRRKSTPYNRGQGRPRSSRSGFTLVEVLVALVLMAVIVPLAVEGMRLATLAGEVAQRKELAARIADKVINEAIVGGQSQFAGQGNEQSGGFQFHWVMTDQPFNPLTSLPVTANPNGVNQNGVNSTIIHEVSVDVTFAAQGKNYDVLLSTLVNMSQQ